MALRPYSVQTRRRGRHPAGSARAVQLRERPFAVPGANGNPVRKGGGVEGRRHPRAALSRSVISASSTIAGSCRIPVSSCCRHGRRRPVFLPAVRRGTRLACRHWRLVQRPLQQGRGRSPKRAACRQRSPRHSVAQSRVRKVSWHRLTGRARPRGRGSGICEWETSFVLVVDCFQHIET